MFDSEIDFLEKDIIKSTCDLIKIPSVLSPSSNPNMPFGENCNKALEFILNLGNKLGFRTKNIDGYCGYIEFGEGNEMLGIIGHLDVVPEGENWTYPPFSGIVNEGKIYGRGAIDDKGPVIASLYAMKIVMDTCKVSKRVRLILGLNEENDWKCIEYYKLHEEIPTLGFSPDADFPCIYAEKGLLSFYLSSIQENNLITITDVDCSNNAINVVPKFCKIVVSVDNSISINECIHKLEQIVKKYNFDIKISYKDNNISITSFGVSAHSAHPDLGVNAISRILIVLHELFAFYNIKNEFLDFFYKKISLDYSGKNLKLNITDESGSLTLNVANISLTDNTLKLGINIRIPVHTSINFVKEKWKENLKNTNISISFTGEKQGLYIDKNSPLITSLSTIFHNVTGLDATPIAIGGATYARAFPNCVSFGSNFPGNKDMCHQVDEFIKIDHLLLATKIYANAIYELTKE